MGSKVNDNIRTIFMQWYYTINGERKGPVESSKIHRLISDRILTGNDYLWNETMGDQWSLISDLPEFADNMQAPPLPKIIDTIYTETVMPYIRPPHLDGSISCTAAVNPAWERMKDILFRPFDMRKWFILGVSAWLATLGEGGRSSGGGNRISDTIGNKDNISGDYFSQGIAYIQDFWCSYSNYIIIVAILLTLLIVGASLLVGWLKARGKFMLLDNVLNNSEEISAPWAEFKQHANSLFLWYIFFSIINMIVFLIIGGIALLSIAIPCINAKAFAPAAIPGIVAVSILTLLYITATAYITRFVEDFIIPIMYNFDMTVTEAWHKFKEILSKNSNSFIIYGLFYLLLGMFAGIAVITFVLATCLVGACLMMIPFIGTVVMLPITIFFRAYSVEYLAQFGDEFICFPDEKDSE